MSLKKEVESLKKQKEALLKKLQQVILNLHDNPKIKRIAVSGDALSEASSAFTMNMSDLSRGLELSPDFYDFKYQYKMLVQKLEKSDDFVATIENAIKEKEFKIQHKKILLHPDVIKELQKLL